MAFSFSMKKFTLDVAVPSSRRAFIAILKCNQHQIARGIHNFKRHEVFADSESYSLHDASHFMHQSNFLWFWCSLKAADCLIIRFGSKVSEIKYDEILASSTFCSIILIYFLSKQYFQLNWLHFVRLLSNFIASFQS